MMLASFSAVPVFGNTITVTDTSDGSPNSLRAAIAAAAPGDTINFSVTGTITLTSGQLLINKNLRISGPGASSLAISGNSLSTVFHVASGTVALSGLTIKNGSSGSGNGGGIYNAGTLILSNSTLSGNGGGMFNDTSGTLIVINSTISGNNSYTGATSYGGGMFNNGGIVALTNSTVSGNLGAIGAGIYNGGGTFTVTDSTFSSNDSRVCCGGGNGGGIYNAGGTLTVTNTTFSGNLSYYGGGIYNAGGTLTVSNSTLSGNWANNNGSDIFNSASATLKNSIMATGGPGAPGNCFLASGSFTSQGYNLSDDNSCSLTGPGDLNNTPAGLAPSGLQNNGGPTQTIALLATSPAVNAIPLNPTNYCADVNGAPITTDQRAVTRPQGAACDIGAFELVLGEGAGLAQLNGSNTFTGNQTVNGTVAATTFTGNGAGLTGVTAANSLTLGGIGAGNYARLDIGNIFSGSQTVNGSVSASSFAGDGSALTNIVASTANMATFAMSAGDAMTLGHVLAGNYARLDIGNAFTGNQTITSGNLALDNTNGTGTTGVITLGGSPFLSNFGTGNIFVGQNAGNFTTTNSGSHPGYNTGVGLYVLSSNTTGYNNTASGALALQNNTSGFNNTATGLQSLYSNTNGSFNTAFGYALISNTTGSNNTAVGFQAGVNSDGANANTTGSNNTFLGYFTGPETPTQLTNATAIGSNAVVNASNALVLGSINGVNGATSNVNVGIGTATPGYALDVQGGQINASGGLCLAGTCQTSWPSGGGTITGVTAGSGLAGGGTTGNVSLGVDRHVVAFQSDLNNGISTAESFATSAANAAQSNAINTAESNASSIFLPLAGGTLTGGFTASTVNSSGSYQIGGNTVLNAPNTGGTLADTFIGMLAGPANTGGYNTFVGYQAGAANTTGSTNTFVGQAAGYSNTTGTGNSFYGIQSGNSNTTGSNNTFVGFEAGYNATVGSNNIELGNSGSSADNGAILIGRQGTQTATYIAGIYGGNTTTGVPVYVDSNGHLGTGGGSGVGSITGVTAGAGLSGGGSTGSVSLSVDGTVVRTNASNAFTGNQTVNGTVTATAFAGDGSALTKISALTAVTAASTSNALALGGQPPAFYATTGANSFTGNQSFAGHVGVNITPSPGISIFAAGSDEGIEGIGNVYGVFGSSTGPSGSNSAGVNGHGPIGVSGTGVSNGVTGEADGVPGTGVNGFASSTTGNTVGVFAQSDSNSGTGVLALSKAAPGVNTAAAGVFNNAAGGNILLGQNNGTTKISVDGAGNMVLSGGVTATSFTGDGSHLTGVAASNATTASGLSCAGCIGNGQLGVNYAGSASQGGPATSALSALTANSALTAASATTADNASNLNGVSASSYARLDISNTFVGNQTLPNLTVTGTGYFHGDSGPSGTLLSVNNTDSIGTGVSGTGSVAGISGSSSSSSGIAVSAFSFSGSGNTRGVAATVSSPAGIAGVLTNTAGGKILSLQNGAGEVSSVDGNGIFHFATGQTFPAGAAGLGTITGVAAGSGLFGGGTTGNVSLSIPMAGVTNGMLANPTLSVIAGAGLTGGGSVSLGGSTTVALAPNTCAAGSAVTAHPFTCSSFAGLSANTFAGTQTMPNLSVSGNATVSGTGAFGNGVQGTSSSNYGVFGTGGTDGVHGVGTNYGVFGFGAIDGVHGVGNSNGVFGFNNTNGANGSLGTATNIGVYGSSISGSGVVGNTANGTTASAAAGVFNNGAAGNAGNILLGQSAGVTKFSVDGKGDVAASGNVTAAGSVTIGTGGTPILEHLSQTFSVSVPGVSPNNCANLTPVTFTGASDGYTIALGVPNALVAGTPGDFLEYFGWVSATNQVTVRVCNPHGGSANNPVSGTIRVDIWKH